MEPLSLHHIARNTLLLILRDTIGIVCLFLTNIILARYLGQSGMGQIACYSSIFMALLIFVELGTPRAVTILTAKSLGESTQIETIPRLFSASLSIGAILWLIQLFLFGMTFFTGIHFLPSGVTRNILFPLLGAVPFLLYYANVCGVFNGFRMMNYTLTMGIIYNLCNLLFVSVPVVLGGKASGVVWSWLATGAITGIVSAFLLRNFLSKQRIHGPFVNKIDLKRVLKLGVKLWGQGPLYYQYGVILAISFQRPETEVGLMMISFALINLLEIVFGPLEIVLTASVATVHKNAQWSRGVGDLQPPLMNIAATLKLLALCLFTIAGKEILGLFYGGAFREAYPLLVMLGVTLYFDCVKYATDSVLNASGASHLVMVAEVTKIVLATLLSAFIAAKYPISYVALSLFIASFIPTILKIFFVSKVIGQRLWKSLGQLALPWIAFIMILSTGVSLFSKVLLLVTLAIWIYFLRKNLLSVASILVEAIQKTLKLKPMNNISGSSPN